MGSQGCPASCYTEKIEPICKEFPYVLTSKFTSYPARTYHTALPPENQRVVHTAVKATPSVVPQMPHRLLELSPLAPTLPTFLDQLNDSYHRI